MQLGLSLVIATLLATACAYETHVFFVDGLEIKVTGDQATPCQDFPPVVKGNQVNRVTFDKGPYTSKVRLWSEINCGGQLIYEGSAATYDINPPIGAGSFKIE